MGVSGMFEILLKIAERLGNTTQLSPKSIAQRWVLAVVFLLSRALLPYREAVLLIMLYLLPFSTWRQMDPFSFASWFLSLQR